MGDLYSKFQQSPYFMMPLQSFTDCALINKKMLGYTEDDYKVQIPQLFRCWQKNLTGH